jgi:uncharacterized protein YkwD
MLLPPLDVAHVPTRAAPNPHGVCLLHPIRTVRAALAATPFASLGTQLSSHRAATRVSLAALAFIFIAVASQQSPAQAGPEPAPVVPESLLPQSVGMAIDTRAAIQIPFDSPMDAASVESTLSLLPEHSVEFAWNPERTVLTVAPERLWRTDERYLVVIGAESLTADAASLGRAKRFSFTTATAPRVSDFQLHLAAVDVPASAESSTDKALSVRSATLEADPTAQAARDESAQPLGTGAARQQPTETAKRVSASTAVSIGFSAPMNRADVELRFAITPAVEGSLGWVGDNLVFTPSERLRPGTRYTISLVGAHDEYGNPLGGDENFSFVVQRGAQLLKTSPAVRAEDVEPTRLEMWFSQPMDRNATARAIAVTNSETGSRVWGKVTWNDSATRLVFTPKSDLAAGTTYSVVLRKGGRDADGNVLKSTWWFSTKALPPVVVAPPPPAAAAPPAPATGGAGPAPRPSVPVAAPGTSLAGYALNQVNAARAAYGFAPVVLDAKISAVASAHAWDQARNNYFSHFGQNGSSRQSRLAAGGVSFNWSGENQCYHVGMSQQATLNWCHQQFMSEPYPGHFNHIANILNPKAKRMGVGIATVGGKTVITWNFTD